MRKFNITVNGNTYEVDVEEVGQGSAPVAAPAQAPAPAPVAAAPQAAPAQAPAPKAAPSGGKTVAAPMPGNIVAIKVKAGDTVSKDTVVAILEAMKMENEIFAGVDGTVGAVLASQGASVNTGDAIVSIN